MIDVTAIIDATGAVPQRVRHWRPASSIGSKLSGPDTSRPRLAIGVDGERRGASAGMISFHGRPSQSGIGSPGCGARGPDRGPRSVLSAGINHRPAPRRAAFGIVVIARTPRSSGGGPDTAPRPSARFPSRRCQAMRWVHSTPSSICRSPATRRSGSPANIRSHARGVSVHVPRAPVDDASVRGVRDRRGDERALPLPARPRPDGAVDGVRHAVTDGPRLGSPAVSRGGRSRGRGGRHGGGHGDAVRRHPARRSDAIDDDQRPSRRSCSRYTSSLRSDAGSHPKSSRGRSRRTS